MRKILLDTNAYCTFMTGDQDILKELAHADLVYMSIFVLGELLYGFKGGSKQRRNRQLLDQFLKKATVHVLDATSETANIFGDIKHALRKAGTPIPMNDVWIAAHAKEVDAELITYDNHFRNIPELRLWNNLE